MLKIRFTRTGKKDEAHYRIVVAEHSAPVLGRFVEILGHYDPKTKKTVLKKERIEYWLSKGAKPSNTVAKILVKEGLKHNSIIIKTFKKKPKAKKGAEGKPQTGADMTPKNAEKAPSTDVNAPKADTKAPETTPQKPTKSEAPKQEEKKPAATENTGKKQENTEKKPKEPAK